MPVAFVFPGQGSQAVGMGQALAQAYPEARGVLDEADAALGGGLLQLLFEGPDEELRKTANTQPAILAGSIAAHRALAKEAGGRFQHPLFYAGHSLGEYSALVAAGAMQLQDAVRALRARGTFMQEAVPAGEGAMAAILGLEPAQVAAACADAQAEEPGLVVEPANYNSPDQTVIAGHAPAVDRAISKCKERGAKRAVPLPVSAALGVALGVACASGNTRKALKDACTRNLDCAYGLECVDASGTPVASAEDAGKNVARTCQWKSFGDCDVPESADGGPSGGTAAAGAPGGQQCLAGYKCREGKCTVMCAGDKDCRQGEPCKIGLCQRQSGGARAQWFDNRGRP